MSTYQKALALINKGYHFNIHEYSGKIPARHIPYLIWISLLVPPVGIFLAFFLKSPINLRQFSYPLTGFSQSPEFVIDAEPLLLGILIGLVFLKVAINMLLSPLDLLLRAKRENKAVAWEDCFVFSLASVVIGLVSSVFFLETPLREFLIQGFSIFFSILDNIDPLVSVPFIVLALFVYIMDDVFFYIGHRLAHNIRVVWKLGHMQHHRTTNLTTATQSADFGSIFLNGGGGSFITSIIGKAFFFKLLSDVDASTAIGGALLIAGLNIINHTMSHSYSAYLLFSKYPALAWLENIFVTGRIHYVHHSKLPEHNIASGCNFAAQFTLIDKLLGTYAKPSQEVPATGLFHEIHPPGNPIKFALDQWIKFARELYFNSPEHWPKIFFADPSYEPPHPAYPKNQEAE